MRTRAENQGFKRNGLAGNIFLRETANKSLSIGDYSNVLFFTFQQELLMNISDNVQLEVIASANKNNRLKWSLHKVFKKTWSLTNRCRIWNT